jgi:hypothetical protein
MGVPTKSAGETSFPLAVCTWKVNRLSNKSFRLQEDIHCPSPSPMPIVAIVAAIQSKISMSFFLVILIIYTPFFNIQRIPAPFIFANDIFNADMLPLYYTTENKNVNTFSQLSLIKDDKERRCEEPQRKTCLADKQSRS